MTIFRCLGEPLLKPGEHGESASLNNCPHIVEQFPIKRKMTGFLIYEPHLVWEGSTFAEVCAHPFFAQTPHFCLGPLDKPANSTPVPPHLAGMDCSQSQRPAGSCLLYPLGGSSSQTSLENKRQYGSQGLRIRCPPDCCAGGLYLGGESGYLNGATGFLAERTRFTC